jgi:FdhD protein
MTEERTAAVGVLRVTHDASTRNDDLLAVEEPLEIRVAWTAAGEQREKNISVTMRTPGDDFDLAAGFLMTEGLISAASDIESIRNWGSPNVVRVALREGVRLDSSKLDRHFYTTSSCGVCGKTSIEALRVAATPLPAGTPIVASAVHRLPALLEQHQSAFRSTGGLHGAAVINSGGDILRVREDIGRHNAVDKAIGSLFREGMTPLRDTILMVSSRAGFEIAQKAIMAGIPVLATVGAPSTLAVDLAREFNLTLLGFVRDGRFNVYAGEVA